MKLTPDAEWSFIDVDQEVYPFLVLLPLFRMPDDLSGYTTSGNRGAVAQRFWIRGASFRDGITRHLDILAAKLKVAAIEPQGSASVPEFIRMLAKIAHAFAVAELGLNAFSPLLMPIIRDDETSNCAQHIGGVQYAEPATPELHEVSFDAHTCKRPDIVAVRIRLLASLETPTYYVAVGLRQAQPLRSDAT